MRNGIISVWRHTKSLTCYDYLTSSLAGLVVNQKRPAAADYPPQSPSSTMSSHHLNPPLAPNNNHRATEIDGKLIANDIKATLATEISNMKNSIGKVPGLGVVLVGTRKDSLSFVQIKKKACEQVGIAPLVVELPEDCTESEVLDAVTALNYRDSVHGILVQLPLPSHMNEEKIINAVNVEKDVDGFHPINMGNLAMTGRSPLFIPCASRGCIEVLHRYGVEIIGKKAVVIGRSKITGLPTSLLLERHHATVSVVHAFTKNPEEITSEADILVSDVGVPNLVRGHWLKPGVVVIDMGSTLVKDSNSSHGCRVTGDVCYKEAMLKASAITPVPGGIGPVTISMLLSNTVEAAKHNNHRATEIDGKLIANDIKATLATEISNMKNSIGKVPGLGVVLVGTRKDSLSFVQIKKKACEQVGIAPLVVELPEDCTESEVLDAVTALNYRDSVHGILVQLPLPSHMNEEKIINAVNVEKDVDGFHPINMGNLAMTGRSPLFIPCASRGCIEVLHRYGVEIIGKKAVVIGRSKITGLPTSLLLERHHATVSVVHAFTKNPEEITSEADILVSDVGVPNLVRGHWLKPGVVVIDMGSTLVKDSNSSHGCRVTGDVCYKEAMLKASAITPVPGGIGPVTISMLLSNTVEAAKRAYQWTGS
nr:bifunctional protein FolD 1, mitochondrial-like isoform X1 [Tanacetum cinerariifolium]